MKVRAITYYFAAIAALTLFISGCRRSEPTQTPAPQDTVEPTDVALAKSTQIKPTAVEPTKAAPIDVPATAAPEAADQGPVTAPSDYQNVEWAWVFFSDPAVGPQDIPEPERYQIVLNDYGTINVHADCNMLSGDYTAEEGSIMIDLGPSTFAACPEDSLADQFLQNLAAARIMFFEEDDMLFDLVFDSGTMRFSKFSDDD